MNLSWASVSFILANPFLCRSVQRRRRCTSHKRQGQVLDGKWICYSCCCCIIFNRFFAFPSLSLLPECVRRINSGRCEVDSNQPRYDICGVMFAPIYLLKSEFTLTFKLFLSHFFARQAHTPCPPRHWVGCNRPMFSWRSLKNKPRRKPSHKKPRRLHMTLLRIKSQHPTHSWTWSEWLTIILRFVFSPFFFSLSLHSLTAAQHLICLLAGCRAKEDKTPKKKNKR